MRLTGGHGKGRKLFPPPAGTRPTSARVRQVLFQLLRDRLEGAVVLDLFAGTGSLGLEALARGAVGVVFVEKSPAAVRLLNRNIKTCGLEAVTGVRQMDVFTALKHPERLEGPFSIILADPPYDLPSVGRILSLVIENDLLLEEGVFVLECASRQNVDIPAGWAVRKEKIHGDTRLLILKPGNQWNNS